jgi:16S rRNA (cytidine1402-2'-O)-methyltransferase
LGFDLISSYAPALSAARTAAAAQHYPQGALYMVATPIGNLADISLRALHLLELADSVACEDTRHAGTLLRGYGIDKSSAQLLALHEHNEAQACAQVLQRLEAGQRVALVSDAGTPAISDPGDRLVAAVRQAGRLVLAIPGACSVTAALSVAGVSPVAGAPGGFVFAGFLPTRAALRDAAVAALAMESRSVVLLEAPHRIEELARALSPLGPRLLTLARELTKQFEQTHTLGAAQLADWLAQDEHRRKGEFVLVLHAQAPVQRVHEALRVLRLLLPELPLRTAVKLAAEITGASRNELYSAALLERKNAGRADNLLGKEN